MKLGLYAHLYHQFTLNLTDTTLLCDEQFQTTSKVKLVKSLKDVYSTK